MARFLGDITASSTGGWYSVISLHGGRSPQAMKREIYRRYPVEERRSLVERLLDRGVAETGSSGAPSRQKQPGQCCVTGRQPPSNAEADPKKSRLRSGPVCDSVNSASRALVGLQNSSLYSDKRVRFFLQR